MFMVPPSSINYFFIIIQSSRNFKIRPKKGFQKKRLKQCFFHYNFKTGYFLAHFLNLMKIRLTKYLEKIMTHFPKFSNKKSGALKCIFGFSFSVVSVAIYQDELRLLMNSLGFYPSEEQIQKQSSQTENKRKGLQDFLGFPKKFSRISVWLLY